MSVTVMQIARGTTTDGLYHFVPGVNCDKCGRFVGRDGYIGIETFEMSVVVASVEGTCGLCLGPNRLRWELPNSPIPEPAVSSGIGAAIRALCNKAALGQDVVPLDDLRVAVTLAAKAEQEWAAALADAKAERDSIVAQLTRSLHNERERRERAVAKISTVRKLCNQAALGQDVVPLDDLRAALAAGDQQPFPSRTYTRDVTGDPKDAHNG